MKQDIFESGCVYHIFNRGNNKENIFLEDKNYYYFLDLVNKHIIHVAEVYCYCLLKNHFHLLIRIKDSIQIPERFQTKPYLPFSNMFNSYTKSINKMYNRTGSLFQEHLHRNRVTDENYLKHLVIYIHLNPVKHGFSNDFKTYPFSSYNNLVSEKSTNLNRKYIIELFDDKNNFEYWHDFNKIKYEGVVKEIDLYDY